jgi:predicted CoA-binding protein
MSQWRQEHGMAARSLYNHVMSMPAQIRSSAAESFSNPPLDDIRILLRTLRVVAVIGFSPRPARPSNNLARQMQRFGLRIIPIRPGISEGLGEPAYANLSDMPAALRAQVDLVNVFRDSRYVPDIVEESLALGMKALWLQEGVWHAESGQRARDGGMQVIMDRCLMRDYARLAMGDAPTPATEH